MFRHPDRNRPHRVRAWNRSVGGNTTQAILRNFDPNGGAMQPENFNLDLKTPCDQTHANLLKSCPPLYPFQYPDRHFYDRPVGPMPYGHEDFLAELAKVGLALAATIVLMALRFGRRRPALFDSRRSWLID